MGRVSAPRAIIANMILTEAQHGLGRHIEAVGPNGALFYLRTLYVDGLVYNVCLALVKISVLCFYQRVFSTTKRTRQLLRITAGLVLAWCISVVVTCVLECLPIKSSWTPTMKGKCIDVLQFYYGSAGSSIPRIGAFRVKCLGIPHQKSTYMILLLNAPFNKQYNYIYESQIAYSQIYLLKSAKVFSSYLIVTF